MIFAIDPGNVESAYVIVTNDLSEVIDKGKVENRELQEIILAWTNNGRSPEDNHAAIEMIASYGMAVGATVFDTCVWIGKFSQLFELAGFKPTYIYRKDEKICLCHSMKAKDANIRQALIDRFGEVGTKKNPGYFYGFKADIWASMAVCTTFHDLYMAKEGTDNVDF